MSGGQTNPGLFKLRGVEGGWMVHCRSYIDIVESLGYVSKMFQFKNCNLL